MEGPAVEDERGKFLIACLVLPRSPPDEAMVKNRLNGLPERRVVEDKCGWSKEMQDEFAGGFKVWPKDERDVKDIIKVHALRQQDWLKMDEALDEDGMIKPVPGSDAKSCQNCYAEFVEKLPWCHQCRYARPELVWKIAGTILYPGDTLLQQGETGVPLETIRSEELRSFFKKPIFLYSHMRVESVEVVSKGAYTDFHTLFDGYRNWPQNIKFLPSAFIPTLHEVATHIIASRLEQKKPKPSARRITNLSARRDPIEASERGCQ